MLKQHQDTFLVHLLGESKTLMSFVWINIIAAVVIGYSYVCSQQLDN